MKKQMKRVTGVVLSLALVISMFPAVSLAMEPGSCELDLSSGESVMFAEESQPVIDLLEEAVTQNIFNKKVVNDKDVRYDLNKDGVWDIEWMEVSSGPGMSTQIRNKFLPLSSPFAFGNREITIPASETLDRLTVLTVKFPPKPIDRVEIKNVNTDLKAGERPAFTAQVGEGSDKASVRQEVWSDANDNFMMASDAVNDWVVISGHTYEYGITLEPKEGYIFDESTELVYKGKTYSQEEIGSTVKVNGSGLELWDFQDDVDVIEDALDELTIDLRKGTATLPQTRALALGASLMAAVDKEQIAAKTETNEFDMDKDGSYDFIVAYNTTTKTGTVTVETDSLSLEKDLEWTPSEETLAYLKEKGTSPYVKKVIFKMAPAAKPFELDLVEGSQTVQDEELDCLINALMAAGSEKGSISYTQKNDTYDFDLDKDGSGDIRMVVNLEGTSAEVSVLDTCSLPEKAEVTTPLGEEISMAAMNYDFFTSVTFLVKPKEPAKDLGDCTIDLSSGTASKTAEEFDAIRASFAGWNFVKKTKTRTDGDKVYFDLDNDGKEDMVAEIGEDNSAVFSMTETGKLTKNVVLTVEDSELTVINTTGRKAYYSKVTVKIPEKEKEPLPFTDVENPSYYYDAVRWAVDNGITTGTGPTTFSPEQACTRAQVVTFLWRGAGSPEPSTSTNPFSDVKAEDYFYKAVLWAVEKNITKGMSETEFAPESPCTRAQVVTFLHRYEETPAPGSITNPFTDVAASDYFYNAVLWAVDKNITKGMTETTFEPNLSCTRAQIVTFLYRDMGTE